MSPDPIQEITDILGLVLEMRCEKCSQEFSEPKGETEDEVWLWAATTAREAYKVGWISTDTGFRCPSCKDDKINTAEQGAAANP